MKLVELNDIRKGQTFVTMPNPNWIQSRGRNHWWLINGDWSPSTEIVEQLADNKPVVLIEPDDPRPDYATVILNALEFYKHPETP